MTASSFADDMISGGGKYAAVFHIAGQPHAETTSTELVAALSDPQYGGGATDAQKKAWAYRAMLFGKRRITTIDYWPSDHVQIVPSLDPDLGKQSISYDESKGLTGGGWGVKFGRDAHGVEYSHFRSGAPAGVYDGLDVMPDPIYDSSVKTGILALDWGGTVGDLTWGNDTGLFDLIDGNDTLSLPTYVWLRSSCLGLRDAIDNADGTFKATAFSGCLRTPREKIIVDTLDDSSHMIVSAPSTSIVGMTATLWLVPMTDAGEIAGLPTAGVLTDLDIYTKPVMFRTGPVKPNPTCDPKQWKISCGFWQDLLNVKIPVDTFEGEIRGYRFSRPPSPLDGSITRPHLEILEWDSTLGTPAYVATKIWLCAAQGNVTYSNKTALAIALDEELQNRTNSDPEANYFSVSYGNLEIGDATLINTHPTIVNGPLAWILRLGRTALSGLRGDLLGALQTPQWEVRFADYPLIDAATDTFAASPAMLSHEGWLYPYDTSNGLLTGWDYKLPTGMKYYYQYNWVGTDPVGSTYFVKLGWDMGTSSPMALDDRIVNYWPLPYRGAVKPYRLSIKHEFDTALVEAEEHITLGGYDTRHKLDCKAESVSPNYIEASPDGTYSQDGVTMLKVITGPGINTEPMYWGQPIYCWPALHDDEAEFTPGDTFRVRQAQELFAEKLSELFRGILGDPTGSPTSLDGLPRRSKVYHVTDFYDDTEDMRQLVDWDRLDQLAPPSLDVTYGLQLSDGHNIRSIFFNVLLDLGIRQTWEYSEEIRAWRMSFETFGVVSPVKALLSGRVLNSHNLISAKPTGTYGNTWLFHNANAKVNYRGGKPEFNLNIPNVTGRAMMASGDKTLKIDDKIMYMADPSALDDYFTNIRQILRRMNSAQPNVSASGTGASLPIAAVGSDLLISSNLVYDLFAGSRGVTDRSAMMTSVTTTISKNKMTMAYNLRLAPGAQGIGPSLVLADANMSRVGTVVTITALETDPANNDFASAIGGLTDLALFGCINYNVSTDTVALRDCDCVQYAVTIVDAHATTWTIAGAGCNMWRGRLRGHITTTLTLDDVANGRCRIDLDANETEFDDTSSKVVFFCAYSDADLQPCQDVYGWNGNKCGMVVDVSANESQGISWS